MLSKEKKEMSIPKIFGGLWLENLITQDKHYTFAMSLYQRGFIQGLQLLVAHPSYYDYQMLNAEEAKKVVSALPEGMEVFIHVGSENRGVDFGQVLDECGHYDVHGRKNGISWRLWNQETLRQAMFLSVILNVPQHIPWGVVHTGYTLVPDNPASIEVLSRDFGHYASGVALEVVPAMVKKEWFSADKTTFWPDECWGLGGTPDGVRKIQQAMPDSWFFLDLTHVYVTHNQAKVFDIPGLERGISLENVLEHFLQLPNRHPYCHFSGTPRAFIDTHDDLVVSEPSKEIKDSLAQFEVVMLEIPFRPGCEEDIDWFQENYLY